MSSPGPKQTPAFKTPQQPPARAQSTADIPNLLSLLGRGRGRGRGRGGTSRARGAPDEDDDQSHQNSSFNREDEVVQNTDQDAAMMRASTVLHGYLEDPFASIFSHGPEARRLPLIRRGSYVRTTAIDHLIRAFLSDLDLEATKSQKQVISLGAGTDTRPLRLFSSEDTRGKGLIYHEVDFADSINQKVNKMRTSPRAKAVVELESCETSRPAGLIAYKGETPSGGQYYCHGVDLRNAFVPKTTSHASSPSSVSTDDGHWDSTGRLRLLAGLRTDVPTVLLSECCLCYLETKQAQAVIDWFTEKIPNLAIIIYEPIQPNDAFGQQMVLNLRQRKIVMPTLHEYITKRDQEERLLKHGVDRVQSQTISDIWNSWISAAEKERVDNLEGLDETEEWELLASHYVVVFGSKGRGFDGWNQLGQVAINEAILDKGLGLAAGRSPEAVRDLRSELWRHVRDHDGE